MSMDVGTHLAAWGYAKGAADLLEVLAHRGLISPSDCRTLARMWADNMHTALTEKGADAADRLDVIEPLDHLIGEPS